MCAPHRNRGIPLVALLLTALVLGAPAAAASSTGSASIKPDIPLWGEAELAAGEGVLYSSTGPGGGSFDLHAKTIEVATTWRERSSDGSSRSGVIVHTFRDARVTLAPESFLVLDFTNGVRGGAEGSASAPRAVPWDADADRQAAILVGPPESSDFKVFFTDRDDAFPRGWDGPSTWAAPTTFENLDPGSLRIVFPAGGAIAGNGVAHLGYGAFLVHVEGRTLAYEHGESQSRSGSRTLTNETRVAFKATQATISYTPKITLSMSPGLSVLYASDPRFHVQGAAGLTEATGGFNVDGETIRLDKESVLLKGRFTLTPTIRLSGSWWAEYSAAMEAYGREMDGWGGYGAPPMMPFFPMGASGPEFAADAVGEYTLVRKEDGPSLLAWSAVIGGGLATAGAAAWFWPHLKWGFARAALPMFTRLSREGARDNKMRDGILTQIQDEPGIHAIELSRRVRCGWGTVVYHLGVLEKMGYVSSVREGRHRRFFPRGATHHYMQGPLALMKNPATAKVFDAIRATPGIKQKELSAALGLAPSTVNWHVGRLESANLVVKTSEGRSVTYHLSALAHEVAAGEAARATP